jgi:hypothetical protein
LPEFSQPTTPQEEFWQAGIKMIEGTTCMEKAQEKELATKAHSLTPLEIEQARWRDSFMFRAYESAHSAEYGDWSAYKVDQEMLDMAKKASEKWTAVYNYLKELAK